MLRSITAKAVLILTFMQLQACAGIAPAPGNDVAAAYDSGIVAISPYNRTIFSSSNF